VISFAWKSIPSEQVHTSHNPKITATPGWSRQTAVHNNPSSLEVLGHLAATSLVHIVTNPLPRIGMSQHDSLYGSKSHA
jgi:hypothetical protein